MWEKFNSTTVLMALLLGFVAWGRIEKMLEWVRDSYLERQKKIDEEMKHHRVELQREIKDLESELRRFSTLLSSYIENTIRLSQKIDNIEKRFDQMDQ